MWGISNYKSSGEKAVANIADIQEVNRLDQQLHNSFQKKFLIEPSLTRLLVSFQANKTQPIYRWYKYKEAFSASLVQLLQPGNHFKHYPPPNKSLSTPGIGTSESLLDNYLKGCNLN
ncbi:hypothetical protein [Limnospira sp. PMC 1042.18]|uniref:hypothetical protein n=1 Tax=Limnospira sp. PMC 1042.18 TaxID=2981018 RepID=UPI0028E0DD6A|nr:hypothetical protein [Limnospira sp. PMC 1042.18]MDT9200027.1 hypothetical protein [Limnospira sp. PMC 1042.18]